ncbi:MAG: helix-turn-helix transcriptional regulator [bacterium]|jgi:PadR family transcriptional regulator PadR
MHHQSYLSHPREACNCRKHGMRREAFVIPCLLLVLKEEPAHGYELLEKLAGLPYLDTVPDPGVVYRHLRQMEEDGLINSHLKPGKGGPARKVYSLNRTGEEYLRDCTGRIARRREALGQFLAAYAAAVKGEKKQK